jgi:hypothetical protein
MRKDRVGLEGGVEVRVLGLVRNLLAFCKKECRGKCDGPRVCYRMRVSNLIGREGGNVLKFVRCRNQTDGEKPETL